MFWLPSNCFLFGGLISTVLKVAANQILIDIFEFFISHYSKISNSSFIGQFVQKGPVKLIY